MELKFYLQKLAIAMAIIVASIGCKTDDNTSISDPVTFDLQVVTVTSEGATIAVKPSDKSAAYFFGAMLKTEFDAFASNQSMLLAEISRVAALADQAKMTPEAYLKANAKQGDKSVEVSTVAFQSAYYAYVYAIGADGKSVSEPFKIEFVSGVAPARAPDLELSLTVGDIQGLDKDVKMTIGGKSSGVISGRVLLVAKSELDAALAAGSTIESIINDDKNSYPLEAVEIEALNSEVGWKYAFRNLTPATAYTTVVKVTNAEGSTIKSITESTQATAGSDGPQLDLSLTRGNSQGKNKSTEMLAAVKATGAVVGRYGIFAKSQVDAALEQGYTLSYIIENNGYAFLEEQLTTINSAEGYKFDIVELEPNRSYTFITKVASSGGTTIQAVSATTTTGIGPVVTMSMVPGDNAGKNTDVNMFVVMKSSGVISARQAIMTKADFDAEIAKGTTPTQILTANGSALTEAELAEFNSTKGTAKVYGSLLPSTAYMHVLEAESENGISLEYTTALTTASGTNTSDMTFSFEVEDLAPTSAILSVIPSNNTESYYFDYLEVSEFEKRTDAQWIASIIGTTGISSSLLNTGIAGYDAAWFDYMTLAPDTEYYLYAFGYDAEKKTATTEIAKHKFKTPTGNEPPTDAYTAWIGTWTVVSTSSEKNQTAISFDITIRPKVVNNTYIITGWGITSYRTRNITATLKSDGNFRINNKQEIAAISTGMLTFTGRYLNPTTLKYALVSARGDGLVGSLAAGNQTATVVGGKFTLGDDPTEHTITTMDCFNNKTDGSWVGYTALTPYKESGYPIGPYALTKTSGEAMKALTEISGGKPFQLSDYKAALAKRAAVKQRVAVSKPMGESGNMKEMPQVKVRVRAVETLNLVEANPKTVRSTTTKLEVSK